MQVSILDVPLMIVGGALGAYFYQGWLRGRNKDWYFFIGSILVGIFWFNVLMSYLGFMDPWYFAPLTVDINRWIWLFYVLSYPLWFMWGGNRMFLLVGRSPSQGGLIWLFTTEDRTEPFEPAWEQGSERERE